MAVKREQRFVRGVGWVKPKPGYCWVNSGANRIRVVGPASAGVWGSRKFGPMSIAEDWSTQ